MTDINTLVISGRLARDGELKTLASGGAVMSFTVAVNRSVKRNEKWEDEVSFIDCVLFGKLAETLRERFVKGAEIAVQGYIRQERWQGKDGKQASRIRAVAERVQFPYVKKAEESMESEDVPF